MGELETKFGDLLKLERERQGLRIEDLSESLRISEANLRTLEAGDPSALPSPVYFNLFSKTYAEALGIDYSATMEAIKADMAEHGGSEHRKPRRGKQSPPRAAAPTTPAAESFADQAEPEPTRPKRKGRSLAVIGSIALVVVILLGGYLIVTQFLGAPTTGGAETSELETAYRNYNWTVPPYEPSDSLRLTLRPRGDSWATILADGDTAIFKNLRPGLTYQVSAQYRMLVSIAVPREVDILLNDREVDLVSLETGRISRIEITQVNVDSLFNPVRQDNTEVLTAPETANPASIENDEVLSPTPTEITGDTTQRVGGA